MVAAPGENVGDDAHRGTYGIDVSAAGDVFFQDVVLHGAGKFLQAGALALGNRDVETEKDGGSGVDGHGSRNFFERDAVEKRFHVFEGVDGNADFADFTKGESVIGIHADLGRKIEGDGEASLTFAEEIAITLVGFDCGAKAGVLAHGPEAAAVHGGIDAASEGEFAGITENGFGIPVGEVFFGIEAIDGNAGGRGEFLFALGGSGGFGFGIRHGSRKIENGNSERAPCQASAADAVRPFSQLASPAERSHREKEKEQSHGNRKTDEPAGDVARPGAQRGVEPTQREDGEDRGDGLVKKLPERAPEAPETALLLRRGSGAYGRRHKNILAQNRADTRKPGRRRPYARPENLNKGTVNGLETTE